MGTKINYQEDFFTAGPDADLLLGLTDGANAKRKSASGGVEGSNGTFDSEESDVGDSNDSISNGDEDSDVILVGGEDIDSSGEVFLEGGDLMVTSGKQSSPSSSSADIKQLQKKLEDYY